MKTTAGLLAGALFSLPLSSPAVEYAGFIGSGIDPAGNVSINRDTADPGSHLGAAAFQSELDTAVAAGFGGVMFTGAASGRTDITALTGSYATGKNIRIAFSRVAVANYGTINQLGPNGDSIVIADGGANGEPITWVFQDLPAGERIAKLGFTLINRTSGTVSPIAQATVHFADTSTLVLTDTIVTGDHDTDNTFFSVDGSANGGITSVTFENTNAGRGFGIDGLAFITGQSGPIVTSSNPVVLNDGSSGTGFHAFTATDPDGGTVSYQIVGGADAGDFVLTGPDGETLSYHPDGAASPAPFALGTPTDADLDNSYELAVEAASSATGETSIQPFTVTIIAPTPPVVTPENIELAGDTGRNDAFIAGDTVSVTWDSSPTGDNNTGLSGVTVDFSEFGGPPAAPASGLLGRWTASYTLPAGNIDATGADVSITATNVNGGTTVAGVENRIIDTEPPVVTDANLAIATTGSGPSGEFLSGDLITVQWTDTGGDNNADSLAGVEFDLSAFGGGNSVPGTETPLGSGTWLATYTVNFTSNEGAGLAASITVDDNAGNSTSIADSATLTIVTPDTVVGSATGVLDESDPGPLATYTFHLDTTPAGPVEITATADADAEVSIDGINFGPSATFTRSDTSPQVIAVRVLDDALPEGRHKSRITHAITATGDPAGYPATFPLGSASVTILDDDAAIESFPLTLTDQGATLQATFTLGAPLPDQSFIVVGYTAEDTSSTSAVSAVEVVPPGSAAAPLANSVYTGLLDGRGHSGLWYDASPSLAAGTYTVNITTTSSPGQSGAAAWVVSGALGIRDSGWVACRDDENGFGGGRAGSFGFNFTGSLNRFAQFPLDPEPLSAVKAGDFVLAIAMLGEDQDRVADPVGEWDTIEEDVDFASGGFTTFQEAAESDAPPLGVELNDAYYRCLLAALAFEFPAPVDETTDTDGDGLPDVYETANGLDPGDPGDAFTDPDGDGTTALREHLFGTLENNRGSVFTFAVNESAPGAATMDLRYGPVFDGRRYQLSGSADAVLFSELETFTASADAAEHITTDAALLDAEVYRLEVFEP